MNPRTITAVKIDMWAFRDLHVPLSRFHALIGPSGSGKSAVLSVLRQTHHDQAAYLQFPETCLVHQGEQYSIHAMLDVISRNQPDAWAMLLAGVKECFPTIQTLHLQELEDHYRLALTYRDHPDCEVEDACFPSGLLRYLLIASLRYIDSGLWAKKILFLDNFDAELHPALIKPVVNLLRDLSGFVQIVFATNNPLVLNQMKGEEITHLQSGVDRPEARLLSTMPDYVKRSRMFQMGDLWVAYGDQRLWMPTRDQMEVC